MTSTQVRAGTYRPELDGLRAVAAMLVFLHHAPRLRGAGVESGWLAGGGWAGVTMFFTLSGFLITTVMLQRERSVGGFYARRVRRLLPALVVFVAVVSAVAWALDDVATLAAVPWVLAYGGNLHTEMGWFGHAWSLGIEEHFYLVWPLIFTLWRSRLLRAIGWLIAVSMAVQVVMLAVGVDALTVRNDDLARFSSILVGCALAVLTHRGWRVAVPVWPFAAAIIGWLFVGPSLTPVPAILSGTVVVPLATAGIIAAWSTRPPRVPRPVAAFGQMSYGFYLWHYPILIWVDRAWGLPLLLHTAVAFALTLWVARLSWAFVEQRFLRQSISNQPVMVQ